MTKLRNAFKKDDYNESLKNNMEKLQPTYLGDLSLIMKDILSDGWYRKPKIVGRENGCDIVLSLVKSSSAKLMTDIQNLVYNIFNDLSDEKIELHLLFSDFTYEFEYVELYDRILETVGDIENASEILDLLSLGYTSAILAKISTNLYVSNFERQNLMDNILNTLAPNITTLVHRHLVRCLEYTSVFHI